MVYEPQSTPRLLVNNMSFRLASICVGYRATCITFNGLHRTVFMLCRVQGIAQRARRAWIQAAAFFCWLASAAASSGPPSVSNRDSRRNGILTLQKACVKMSIDQRNRKRPSGPQNRRRGRALRLFGRRFQRWRDDGREVFLFLIYATLCCY